MSNAIITVENLSKSYFITHEGQRESYTALRDVVANKAKKIFSFPKGMKANTSSFSKKEEFFALKDVSFEINQGDRVGIIGRNGAGKSTLLKIISRIIEPTSGNIRIKGRVASLLEVGTGFHPELTGRENIYLNGAILGMSRAEIRRKFDEIVAFSEVEKFLDTPVKRYSSGMYVRLAFAVAAHLEPEVLIVDEVLAVGDAQFQKKCLGKMEDVSTNEGRTVLFVSHNTNMLNALCNKGFLLQKGKLIKEGSIISVLESYLSTDNEFPVSLKMKTGLFTCKYFELYEFSLVNLDRSQLNRVFHASDYSSIALQLKGKIFIPDSRLTLGFQCVNEKGELLYYNFHTDQPIENWPNLKEGDFEINLAFDLTYLNEGKYTINFIAALHAVTMLATENDSISLGFEKVGNGSNSPYWQGKKNTFIAPIAKMA